MPTKTSHGVTLWAVPRFHRSSITPSPDETGKEWVKRLQTYSFPSGTADEPKRPTQPSQSGQPEICH